MRPDIDFSNESIEHVYRVVRDAIEGRQRVYDDPSIITAAGVMLTALAIDANSTCTTLELKGAYDKRRGGALGDYVITIQRTDIAEAGEGADAE